jgi:coproporphyrinogen III oxidase-like Fe-S oxidoreductase
MINADDIPLPSTKLDILHHTIDRLAESGYLYIGMDHFALPEDDLVQARGDGTLQRNFQGYSTHGECDLVGLGVSSISSIGNVYAQNAVTTMEYETLIENGHLPIKKGIAVDDDDLLRAEVIQALMCYDRLDFDDFDVGHDIDFRNYFKSELLLQVGTRAAEAAGRGRTDRTRAGRHRHYGERQVVASLYRDGLRPSHGRSRYRKTLFQGDLEQRSRFGKRSYRSNTAPGVFSNRDRCRSAAN